MPLVAFQGNKEIFLMELVEGVDYLKVVHFINACIDHNNNTGSRVMSKLDLKRLLLLARTDRERELVKHATFSASGLTKSTARAHFGLEDVSDRASRIDESIREAEAIRRSIECLSQVKEKALLRSLGFSESEESELSSEDESVDDVCMFEGEEGGEKEEFQSDDACNLEAISKPRFLELVQECDFNWFDLVDKVIENTNCNETEAAKALDESFSYVSSFDLSIRDIQKLQESYKAFQIDCDRRVSVDREANAINGQIVSDVESDDPDQYIEMLDIANDKAKCLIAKKRKQFRRQERYRISKELAERNFLSRCVSRKVRGIIDSCPNIGEEIEKFVQDCSIGADAWRRTGVLTFDGNTKVNCKVTYERIRQHIMKVYNRKFSYGTVVQLCIARNKRRLSAKRYKGLAKVTSRRARKGFMLKYNPDAHWSAAFYRNLNVIQYTDGRDIVNINRDDASGFRLDTMATHRLHCTPMVQGSETKTTYTDYVSKYKAVIQTTSYNFSKTETTLELCAGVVKPVGLFLKNPMQHAIDLEMLEESAELKSAFINPLTNQRKLIECIRVDGAADEGPSHEEVQFVWTARHIVKATQVTLVTARNSGSSYLNRVELQNGCLALAHANLFIPSTLGGTCTASGKMNKEKYKENMELATEVYINRVNGCPCGDTVIHLFKGIDSSQQQENRQYILQYLKGSKQRLKKENPAMYEYCEQVWNVRNNHMVANLPSQYIFHLVCCYKPHCTHPLCAQQSSEVQRWYDSGPLVSYLPFPTPDCNRCYGNKECKECKDFCCGHFLKPNETIACNLQPMIKPPSVILKEAFDSCVTYPPSDSTFSKLSEKVMLPVQEVKFWFNHLKTIQNNRISGARKAAETRRKKKPQPSTQLGSTLSDSQPSTLKRQPSILNSQSSTLNLQPLTLNSQSSTLNLQPLTLNSQRSILNPQLSKTPSFSTNEYQCGICHTFYQEFTQVEEDWIGCDTCDTWYHFICAGIDCEAVPERYICTECSG